MSSVGITVYGACAVSFMMLRYALERRGNGFMLASCRERGRSVSSR